MTKTIAFTLGLLLVSAASVAAERKPNIVFLLADDLGYADLACYGHPYARTPNLDRLASEGTRFTQFYSTGATCCPARTGLMTSRFPATYKGYPANAGFGDRVTVTDLLHKQGYRTGHFGKWHIGPISTPGTYGIDDINASDSDGGGGRKDDKGRDDHIYDDAIGFIEKNKDVPFYVNVWGHVTHFPVDPPKRYPEQFKDVTVKDADFAEPMREKFAKARQAGADPSVHMRNFLGDVLSLDDNVGRLLATLDRLGLRENTIVVFNSDQGATDIRLPDPAKAAGGNVARREKKSTDVGRDLVLNSMGYNGPYRGGKHNVYEGGVRVPFIVRWPGHVPAGRVDEQSVISGIDWLPTLCHIAGASLPTGITFDGEDASDAWLGKAAHQRTKPLLWKKSTPNDDVTIRDGQWKAFVPHRKNGEVALYDISADPAEAHDVAAQFPDVVKALRAKAQAWDASLPTEYIKSDDPDDK